MTEKEKKILKKANNALNFGDNVDCVQALWGILDMLKPKTPVDDELEMYSEIIKKDSVLEEIYKLRSDYVCNHCKLPTRLLIDERSYCDCRYECGNKPYVYDGFKIYGMEIFVKVSSVDDLKKCIIVE